jgi:hypothetical protein
MIKKILLSAVLSASLTAGMFGGLGDAVMGGGNSAPSVSANDVSGVISTFQQAEKGLNTSIDLINSALGDKKQIAEWEAKEKTINAMPEGAEKDAKYKELNQAQEAYAKKIVESKDISEKAKNLSSEQKKKVGVSIGNLLLVTLKDKQALDQSKNLVSSISSNPASAMKFASDLPKLKDIVSTVPTQLSSLGTLTSGLASIAKSAGISYETPKSADESLKDASSAI